MKRTKIFFIILMLLLVLITSCTDNPQSNILIPNNVLNVQISFNSSMCPAGDFLIGYNGSFICATPPSAGSGTTWTLLNMTNYGAINSSNTTWVQKIKVDNATWSSNSSGVNCADISGGSDTNYCVDTSGGAGGGLQNNSPAIFTLLNVTYNLSVLGNINTTYLNATSIYLSDRLFIFNNQEVQAEQNGFKIGNFTTQLGNYLPSFWDWADNQSSINTTIRQHLALKLENATDFRLNYGKIQNLSVTFNFTVDDHILTDNTRNTTLFGNVSSQPSETITISGNISTTSTNNTLGNIVFGNFNSSCSGFKKSGGGWFLSCVP